MKIRNGFVSNSSSSSFIIALPRRPTSADDLLTMLKLDNPKDCIPGYYEEKDTPTVNDIIEYIFNKMIEPATDKETAQFVKNFALTRISEALYKEFGSFIHVKCDSPRFDEIILKYLTDNNPKQNKYEVQEIPGNININLLDRDKKRFIFELSDNDSKEGSCAEHGDWFQYIPHLRINQH